VNVVASCIAMPSTPSASTIRIAYDYVHRDASSVFCLAASPTVNSTVGDLPWSIANKTWWYSNQTWPYPKLSNYLEYTDQTYLQYTQLTTLSGDDAYSWSLVGYDPSYELAQDPCTITGNSDQTFCQSEAFGAFAAAGESTPVNQEGWFIAIMVIIAVAIAAVIGFVVWRRRPGVTMSSRQSNIDHEAGSVNTFSSVSQPAPNPSYSAPQY